MLDHFRKAFLILHYWNPHSVIGFPCFSSLPSWLLTPQLVFVNVQIPKIMELMPSRGPVSGGTIVNITGSHLDAGSNVSVMFKDQPCTYLRLVETDQNGHTKEKTSIRVKLRSVFNHCFLYT